MEDKNLNLVPRTSSARKLTYSSEDIKRKGQDLHMNETAVLQCEEFFLKSCLCTKFNNSNMHRNQTIQLCHKVKHSMSKTDIV